MQQGSLALGIETQLLVEMEVVTRVGGSSAGRADQVGDAAFGLAPIVYGLLRSFESKRNAEIEEGLANVLDRRRVGSSEKFRGFIMHRGAEVNSSVPVDEQSLVEAEGVRLVSVEGLVGTTEALTLLKVSPISWRSRRTETTGLGDRERPTRCPKQIQP
jgi:hypothetical protein